MKEIRSDAVVEEMIRHAGIQASGHAVHKSPLDSHHSRKNDVSDSESYKRGGIDIPVDQVVISIRFPSTATMQDS